MYSYMDNDSASRCSLGWSIAYATITRHACVIWRNLLGFALLHEHHAAHWLKLARQHLTMLTHVCTVQISTSMLVKTDEAATIEWAVMANDQVLSNTSRAEFDTLVDTGALPFVATSDRCYPDAPTDSTVRSSIPGPA
eukprot:jgi/Ulvmu1/10120/UM006_0072.1